MPITQEGAHVLVAQKRQNGRKASEFIIGLLWRVLIAFPVAANAQTPKPVSQRPTKDSRDSGISETPSPETSPTPVRQEGSAYRDGIALDPRWQSRLETRVQFAWQGVPLRATLLNFGSTNEVCVFVDRRLDPNHLLDVEVSDGQFLSAMRSVAAMNAWGISVLPHCVYLGPSDVTNELATVLYQQQQRLRVLPAETRKRWTNLQKTSWADLAEPRDLVAEWTTTAQVTVVGLDRIPHDLWPAQELPAMSILERLVLTLAGFQLAPQIEESGDVQVVELPHNAEVTRIYARTSIQPEPLEDWQAKFPRSRIERTDRQWSVTGPVESHRLFRNWLNSASTDRRTSLRPGQASQPISPRIDRQTFSLVVREQPLDAILNTLVRQTQTKLQWDDGAEAWKKTARTVSVKNATLDELLKNLLEGLPLQGQLEGSTLHIRANTRE